MAWAVLAAVSEAEAVVEAVEASAAGAAAVAAPADEAPHSRAMGYLVTPKAIGGSIDHALSQPQQNCGV